MLPVSKPQSGWQMRHMSLRAAAHSASLRTCFSWICFIFIPPGVFRTRYQWLKTTVSRWRSASRPADVHVRDSQQNKCSSPRSLPSRLCGSDFSRQPKWNSLILESPLAEVYSLPLFAKEGVGGVAGTSPLLNRIWRALHLQTGASAPCQKMCILAASRRWSKGKFLDHDFDFFAVGRRFAVEKPQVDVYRERFLRY